MVSIGSVSTCFIRQELVRAKQGAVEMPSFHVWGLEEMFFSRVESPDLVDLWKR